MLRTRAALSTLALTSALTLAAPQAAPLPTSPTAAGAAPRTAQAPATLSSSHAAAAPAMEIVTSGQEQCDKPLAQRTGNWACPRSAPNGTAATQAAPGEHGFCTYQGCWDQLDSVRTTYKGEITYGYGKKILGLGTLYFKTTASGSRNVSDWYYLASTRGRGTTELTVERLYLSDDHPAGKALSPPAQTHFKCGARSAYVKCRFPSGRAVTIGRSVAWYTMKHEATWTDISSAYPGHWFAMAKSVKYRRSSTGKSYIADSKARRPTFPAASGYLP